MIDKNSIQSLERTKDVINIKKLNKILSNFNFDVSEIDGHNIKALIKLIKKKTKKPSIVICNTIKGKGIKEIENKITSHYYPATSKQFENL